MKHYRTQFEATIAEELTSKEVAFEYEPTRLRYTDQGGRKRITQPDFFLKARSNDPTRGMFVEAKSLLKRDHLSKYESLKETRPEVDLRFVFEEPERTIGNLTTEDGSGERVSLTYADWADMNGFKWNGEAVPNAWLKELKKK